MSSSESDDDEITYPTMMEPCKAKYRVGKKGSPVLIDDNCYQYRRKNARKGHQLGLLSKT